MKNESEMRKMKSNVSRGLRQRETLNEWFISILFSFILRSPVTTAFARNVKLDFHLATFISWSKKSYDKSLIPSAGTDKVDSS